jgi:hypothetical protein
MRGLRRILPILWLLTVSPGASHAETGPRPQKTIRESLAFRSCVRSLLCCNDGKRSNGLDTTTPGDGAVLEVTAIVLPDGTAFER